MEPKGSRGRLVSYPCGADLGGKYAAPSVQKLDSLEFRPRILRVRLSFLSIQAERFQDRFVVHGEENGCVARRSVGVLMPGPQRHDEGITLLPIEFLAVDHGRAAAAERVVDARAGMAVRLGFLVRPKHLHATGHRGQGRTAGCRIDEFESGGVKRVSRRAREALQSRIGIPPVIV